MTLTDAILSNSRLEIARAYIASGLSVVPVKADGSKSPSLSGWRAYSSRLASDEELQGWFTKGGVGIGVVPGPASGNLVVLDFENKYSRSAYSEWLQGLSEELLAILPTLPLVRTPSGGRHLWIRLSDAEAGGKLSRYASGTTKVEVRGNGHQVLAPGCPAECHSSGGTYQFECMGWLT